MTSAGWIRKKSSTYRRPRGARTHQRACVVGLASIAVVASIWIYLASARDDGDGGSGGLDKSNNIEIIQGNTTEYPGVRRFSYTEKSRLSSRKAGSDKSTSMSMSRSSRSRPDHARRVGGGLVFIKSFKTGSTTLATYIAQIGHQKRAYFLHPRATGWFAQGELESRRDQGQTFDISLRHITPYTPYNVLEALVPGAVFATIMRDPVERFLSLFNFRGEIKRKFRYPGALVAAIRAGELPLSDARPFCNQLAWLMSGEDIDYTRIDDDEEASRVAEAVIDEADRRNVTVLLTERMSESVAVLAHRMGWRMDELTLRVSSQRVQQKGREPRFFSCEDNKDHACVSAIRRCNLVDGLLYEHYKTKFDDLVQGLPSTDHASHMLNEMSPAKSSMSRLELGSFPVNCIEKAPSEDDIYSRLHSCGGRPV